MILKIAISKKFNKQKIWEIFKNNVFRFVEFEGFGELEKRNHLKKFVRRFGKKR